MQRTIKRGSARDLTLEYIEIDESLMLHIKTIPRVKEVDGIVRDSRSRATGRTLITSSVRLHSAAKKPQFFPFAPSHPPARAAKDGLKHLGIKHSSIYKARDTGMAVAKASYIEAHGHEHTAPQADGASLRVAQYIEGVHSPDRERVVRVCSNVGETYKDRIAFWRSFEAQATFRGDHSIEIDIRQHAQAWAELISSGVQKDIADAYEMARAGNGEAVLVVNDANAAKRFSKSAKHQSLFSKTLSVNCPANEIVMSSVIALLPHELSMDGKIRVFERYCDLFARRGLPFQGVIHEPVEGKNDSRNWHVHLNYLPYAMEKDPSTGKWSFEPESYYDAKSRKTRTRKRSKYKRHGDTLPAKEGGWVTTLKAEMCEIANEELIAEGLAPKFTVASNSERGLGKAEKPRGPKADALRKKGVRSLASVEADRASWQERAKDAAIIEGAATIGRIYRKLGLSTHKYTPDEQARFDEIVQLARLAELARWREEELLSGRRIVQRNQKDVIADKRASQKKRAEAEAVLKACQSGLAAEAELLDRLQTFRGRAAEQISLHTEVLAKDIGRSDTVASGQMSQAPTLDVEPAPTPQHVADQIRAETFRAARERAKALWRRQGPRELFERPKLPGQIKVEVSASIAPARHRPVDRGIDR